MQILRKNLHELNNLLNQISVPLGCLKVSLKDEPLHMLNKEELKKRTEELIQNLAQLEEKVMHTNRALSEMARELEKITF